MRYLSDLEILKIHARLLDASGGTHGIRDIGLFKSIIEKPKLILSGAEMYPGIFMKAAVYFESISSYHVFVDGNKRTAITVSVRFLYVNGYTIDKKEGELEPFVIKAVTEKWPLEKIAHWFEKNSKKPA